VKLDDAVNYQNRFMVGLDLALAWLRATELATDAIWARSPAFRRPGAREAVTSAGLVNLAMTLAFGARGRGGPR
jgi:hypothetical protein